MSDKFTDRELYEQAWGNGVAMAVATHEFLKQQGIDPKELATFFGQMYAEGWGEERGDLKRIAYYVALNMATFGFSTETTHEDDKATVKASWTNEHDDPDWPIPVKPALTEDLTTSFEPIMSWLGGELFLGGYRRSAGLLPVGLRPHSSAEQPLHAV